MKEAFLISYEFFYYIPSSFSMWYHIYIIPYTGEVSNKEMKNTCKIRNHYMKYAMIFLQLPVQL